ncbi:MAG: transcription termination/antitermination protein NusA, partial [Zetaproteobacteria bacterium]
VEDPLNELSLEEARKIKPDAEVGDELREELPTTEIHEFGRIMAQSVKQALAQRLREVEAERVYEEYAPRVGELTTGIVKKVERGNVYLDLGRTEAVMYREDCIPRETFRQGDRVRVYIREVRKHGRGPQVIVSRTDAGMLLRLFEQEVPEIQEGLVEIKAVAREPGVRAKVAVASNDPMIDPVGACVGARGARVQAVTNELHGERIDIIEWSEDPAVFVVNALAPAEIERVLIDEARHTIEVTVREDQLATAIGRNGLNVRLASQLTGWEIDVITVAEEQQRRQEEIERAKAEFGKLGVEEPRIEALVAEGFLTIEDLAYCELEELVGIDGMDEEEAHALQTKARDWLLKEEMAKAAQEAGEGMPLDALEGLPGELAEKLIAHGIRTVEELAEAELEDFADFDEADRKALESWIIEARRKCGWFDEG